MIGGRKSSSTRSGASAILGNSGTSAIAMPTTTRRIETDCPRRVATTATAAVTANSPAETYSSSAIAYEFLPASKAIGPVREMSERHLLGNARWRARGQRGRAGRHFDAVGPTAA